MFTLGCEERYGDKVVVIDSQLVCSYMGNLVKFADKLNKEGRPVEEIVE
jgi:fatty acid-binding protein DegV